MRTTTLAVSLATAASASSASAQFAALTPRVQQLAASEQAAGPTGALIRPAPAVTLSTLQEDPAPIEIPPSFWDGWKGSVAFGLNGNAGNTDNLSFRGTIAAKRTTDYWETTLGFLYAYSNRESIATENRTRLDVRNDWFFSESRRWRYFLSGFVEYNEFQDWDLRFGAYNGFGYDFIKSERTTLTGRAGLGAKWDMGGENEDIRFEGLLGLDWTHQLNDRNKFYASLTYYPVISDVPEFRIETKAGWEIKLDETNGMFLNLGIEDRYDSNPGGTSQSNDFAYFALLGWNF